MAFFSNVYFPNQNQIRKKMLDPNHDRRLAPVPLSQAEPRNVRWRSWQSPCSCGRPLDEWHWIGLVGKIFTGKP